MHRSWGEQGHLVGWGGKAAQDQPPPPPCPTQEDRRVMWSRHGSATHAGE